METLNFPNYFSTSLVSTVFIALVGLGLTVSAVYGWKARFRQWKNRTSDHEIGQVNGGLIVMTFMGPIFLLVGIISTVVSTYSSYQFSEIKLDEINVLIIYKIEHQHQPLLINPREFNDKKLIRDGMMLIRRCSSTSLPPKLQMTDGYKFHLMSDKNEHLATISVYKELTTLYPESKHVRSQRSFVIDSISDTVPYICQSFFDWLEVNIDPLFTAENTK